MQKLSKIIFVDDDPITIMLNKRILASAAICNNAEFFGSGTEAVNFFNELIKKNEPFPDLMLLDIRMPVLDGFGVLEELNNMPGFEACDLKIVMFTSSIDPEDQARAKQFSKVVDFINKPLTKEKVLQIVNTHFQLSEQSSIE